MHQFWWLVPLNNHPVQADKRVITLSTCGWIAEEKEGELSRAGPALSFELSPLCSKGFATLWRSRDLGRVLVESRSSNWLPPSGWRRSRLRERRSLGRRNWSFLELIYFFERGFREGQFCIASQLYYFKFALDSFL